MLHILILAHFSKQELLASNHCVSNTQHSTHPDTALTLRTLVNKKNAHGDNNVAGQIVDDWVIPIYQASDYSQ